MIESYQRFILVLCIVIIALFSALLASCDGEHPAQAPKPDDGWIKMGAVSDSSGGCTVWKKKDDNGKTVYVAIGVNACSVCAVDEAKK
jgi:hypothetical protein